MKNKGNAVSLFCASVNKVIENTFTILYLK